MNIWYYIIHNLSTFLSFDTFWYILGCRQSPRPSAASRFSPIFLSASRPHLKQNMQPQRHVILSPQNSDPGASEIGDSWLTPFNSRHFDLVKACLDVLIFLMISTCLAQPWAPIWKIWKQVWKMICSWLLKTIRNYHIRSYAGMYVEFCRILVVHKIDLIIQTIHREL